MRIFLLLSLFLFTNVTFYAQSWVEKMQDPNANFYQIKSEFDAYWSTHDHTEKGKGYKVFKRWENFVEPRVYPSGDLSQLSLTSKNYEIFLKDYQSKNQGTNGKTIGGGSNLISSATWTAIGPMGAISGSAGGQLLKSGRLNFITITPGNPNTLWIGAPAGGLWKSTNGGTSWSTNTDLLTVNGCSDLAIDPTNTLVMYLATGDGNAGDTRSIGVLKSINGGASWSATGLTNAVTTNFLIRRLLINPSNTQIILAATSTGIYRSTNGGTNWTQVTTNSTFDLEFNTANPSIVYSAGTSFRMSTDGGATWTQISNGIPTTGVNRMAIAVSPADQNYVYVLASSSSNSGLQGFYRSVSGGTAFTQMTTTLNTLGWSNAGTDTGGQGWYDLCIAVSPLDKNEVVTGGVNVWRTLDGGVSWAIYGHWTGSGAPFTHADQHDLEYDASGVLYNANDGTVYRRTGNTWTEISGNINISQIYRMGMSSLSANLWITGHQDNGTSIYNGTAYTAALGGDGMDCFYDRTNNNNVFGEYQNGGMQRSTNGGTSWTSATSGLTGTAPWLTIWKQDPQTNNVLYCGRQDLFISTNLGVSWSSLAPFTATDAIREFAVAPSNSLVIYVLKNSGIYKTVNGGTSWSNVTGSVPVGSGSPDYICIDPTDPNNAWVVLSGYSSGNKVFATTNGGAGWVNFSANLPNLPVNCIVYQPGSNDMVYVGMDVGVYYRDNSQSNWTLYNLGLPNTPISELEITPANPNFIYAATYGRGVWVASLYSAGNPPTSNFTVSSNAACIGSVFTFTNLSVNSPTAWAWSVTPSVGVVISSSIAQNPNITFPSAGNYTVTLQTSNAFGIGTPYSQVINIIGAPVLNINTASQIICPGSTITYSATGANSYTWSNGGGNASIVSYTPTSPSVYTLFALSNGCPGSKTVAVNFYTPPTLTISGPASICVGDGALLQANGGITYSWSTGQTIPFININPSVTTVYSVSATGTNICKGNQFFTLTVNPLPLIDIVSNNSIICLGEEVVLSANGAITYTWSPGNIVASSVSYTPNVTTSFSCFGVDTNGCVNSNAIIVTVAECIGIKTINGTTIPVFSVFPNPAKNKLIIKLETQIVKSSFIEIKDVAGKVVLSQALQANASDNTYEVVISTLAAGNYFIELLSSNGRSAPVKIIKE